LKRPTSVHELTELLSKQAYLADRGLATAVFLGISLGRPILLEGEPGVGKTEMAKALAAAFGSELIRLQCYEGREGGVGQGGDQRPVRARVPGGAAAAQGDPGR
jgi:MoxR-like ATPase